MDTKEETKLEVKDEYAQSLENLLIFMCQTYEEMQKSLIQLYKDEGNDAFVKVPMIQGTGNIIGISKIAGLQFEQPEIGFNEVSKEIQNNRNSK